MRACRRHWAVRLAMVGAVLCLAAAEAAFGQGQNVRLVGQIGGQCRAVYVVGNYAHIGEGPNLTILDVSAPTTPVAVGRALLPDIVEGVFVSGALAYVADGLSGLQIIDVSNAGSPQLRGSYDTAGYANEVYVSGTLAYIADGSGLQIIDVSDPASPQLRGSYDTPGALGVYVSGDLAYVADGYSGLQIIDVSNPASPQWRASYDTPGYAWGVFVSDTLAYVADHGSGLQIVDVSDPTSPQLRGSHAGDAWSVFVSGNLAYVTARGLGIIDVSNPASPRWVGAYSIFPGEAIDVFVSGGLAYVADGPAGLWIFQYTGNAPRVRAATLSDSNNNDVIEAGEQVVLTLDRSVVVTTAALQSSHFFLPVAGDTLGGEGFAVAVNRYNSRQIVLTLGTGVHLTAAGEFTTASLTVGAPSGIDFATSIPFRAIQSLDGISAIDGGAQQIDDSGVDIQFSCLPHEAAIAAAGGAVAVADSPDAAYRRHNLHVPARALATTTTFGLRPPVENLGVIGAVQIESSDPSSTLGAPVTVTVEYREGDIDFERGLIESEMRVHQLVESAQGARDYVAVNGRQRLLMGQRLVSADLWGLNPEGSVGTAGIFAALPLQTVEERTIHIKRSDAQPPPGVILTPGPNGAYTQHAVEFPGYEQASPDDPDRLTVTLRTAQQAERLSTAGGDSWPEASGAIFVVTVADALGGPVAFSDPVDVTVQFKRRIPATWGDCLRLNGELSMPRAMLVAHDVFPGEAVDFQFVGNQPHLVDESLGTVRVRVQNLVGLTGPDGMGTFGAVGSGYYLSAKRWELYL